MTKQRSAPAASRLDPRVEGSRLRTALDIVCRDLLAQIRIAQVAGETASIGWLPYLLFIALVSVSLGVMNLLPLPILDGGHLMYYMVEVLKGSPVSIQTMEIGQRVGIVALVLLMGLALYNDIVRLLGQ